MRSIKELLEVLLDSQEHFSYGLCMWVNRLYKANIISYEEERCLVRYINNHRPSKFSSLDAWKQRNSDFYWPKGAIEPRLAWIHKHIRKQEKNK